MFSFGIIAKNFEVFENDIFDCKILWMVGEGEWNSVGFFVVTFVVPFLDRFPAHDVCHRVQRRYVCR